MRNLLRWSAVLTAMLLVLAACTSTGSSSPSAAGSAAASAAASADAAAICAADAFGCVEIPTGEPIVYELADDLSDWRQCPRHAVFKHRNADGTLNPGLPIEVKLPQ